MNVDEDTPNREEAPPVSPIPGSIIRALDLGLIYGTEGPR